MDFVNSQHKPTHPPLVTKLIQIEYYLRQIIQKTIVRGSHATRDN